MVWLAGAPWRWLNGLQRLWTLDRVAEVLPCWGYGDWHGVDT